MTSHVTVDSLKDIRHTSFHGQYFCTVELKKETHYIKKTSRG